MSEIVTGTPAVVGFTNGNNNHHNGYYYNPGISDKDQMFAQTVDIGEQTRDLLAAINLNGTANVVSTEKNGAANQLATEKVGAAGVLESAKNSAALHVQIAAAASASAAIAAANQQAAMMYANTNASAGILFAAQNQATLAAQLAACCCEIKENIAGVTATILAVDAHRIRDDLNEARNELLALRIAAGGGAAARS